MPAEILRFPNPDELAESAARQWLAALEGLRSPTRPYSVALSGGRISRNFFSALASAPNAARILSNVHFFWADERCVPPSDPESNFGITSKLLLEPLKIPEQHIHRIRGENPPAEAARAAVLEVEAILPATAEGQRIFDIVFLGMGEDGHVASLFPGESAEAMQSPAIYRAVRAVKPPPDRITLGYSAVLAAHQAWVLATGAGKQEALRRSLTPSGDTPLGRVLGGRDHTRIFTDIEP